MSTRRKLSQGAPSGSKPNNTSQRPQMNFARPQETTRNDAKGTKPTAQPASIREVMTLMILHGCKKTIFFDVRLKVALYLAALFLVSLIGGNSWQHCTI